jgi:hypothetical protein
MLLQTTEESEDNIRKLPFIPELAALHTSIMIIMGLSHDADYLLGQIPVSSSYL